MYVVNENTFIMCNINWMDFYVIRTLMITKYIMNKFNYVMHSVTHTKLKV